MNLPDHLCPKAAMALFDFVTDLEHAIWEKYEHLLIPLCLEQLQREQQVHNPDEAIATTADFDDQLPLF